MTQNWIVAVLVLLAASYSLWYLLPNSLRQRLGRIHVSLGPGKPCASCSNCGGCASGKLPAEASAAAQPEQAIRFYPARKG